MRLIFAGTPQFSVPSLNLIHKHSQHEVAAVLTNPDSVRGRGRNIQLSPVKVFAQEHGIPCIQPERLGATAREQVKEIHADILVAVAYGKIFGPKFLSLFPRGGINLHPSLLPKYRGPAPIPAAILAGDGTSGISVQELALEMDAGALLLQEKFSIGPNDDNETLTQYCSEKGAAMLIRVLDEIEAGSAKPREQEHSLATYCSMLRKADGLIDWRQDAAHIHRLVRAFVPWPLAHTTWNGKGLNIRSCKALEEREIPSLAQASEHNRVAGRVLAVDKSLGILVQTGNGVLAVDTLQLESKRAMDFKSFLNGNPQIIASLLGGESAVP